MSPHPNAMVAWDSITCQQGHTEHATIPTTVQLGAGHGYGDLAPVPSRFSRDFEMMVYDTDCYSGPGYCPANDAVSETIRTLGIWEPAETVLTLAACEAGGELMVDFGIQIGWFALLAASCGLDVIGFEADPANAKVAADNFALNDWAHRLELRLTRIDERTEVLPATPITMVKIDVEGAENHAMRIIGPSLDAGLIDHLLIEISPCFADYYPDLVADLVGRGFEAYRLPPKQRPPASLEDPQSGLRRGRIDTLTEGALRDLVASWEQENIWFAKPDAGWG